MIGFLHNLIESSKEKSNDYEKLMNERKNSCEQRKKEHKKTIEI